MVVVINENQLKRIVGNITKSNLIENTIEDEKEVIKDLIDDFGLEKAVKYVGGIDKLIEIYGGFNEFNQEFFEKYGRYPVYVSSDGMEMYIADFLSPIMNKQRQVGKQIFLNDNFKIKTGGINYSFTVILVKVRLLSHDWSDNQYFWKVTGTTGSHGFGLSFISKRETFGKRARKQVFDQVIEKYNLKPFMG